MRKKGFSLIEIIATIGMLGIIAVPFFSIFLSGNKNVIAAKHDLVAVNLARERIEQMRLQSFETLEEDYHVYRDIYKDTVYSEFKEADEDVEVFYDNFTDIWTSSMREKYPGIYSRMENIFTEVSSLGEYIKYPDEFSAFRRYAVVEEVTPEKQNDFLPGNPVMLKRITVKVFFEDEIAVELTTLVSDYK